MTPWLATAERIARAAHANQLDKSGAPYIHHPERVARITAGITPSEVACAAAWLHDVIEDTAVTTADLRHEGIPENVIEVVDLMTHRADEDVDTYMNRLRTNPLAKAVKVADLIDNSSPARIDALPPALQTRLRAKYHHMWELLLGEG
ncbi:HD domain-containing protein [Corynebacterium sp.]|uniref:HD domain-containing protein n=1 Tax=Corynebacterium sp. TaxID=1720 RepID=UPI0026DDAFE1|nr:HD domain-containing protein [Corynebacterium sp.]MDO5077664.1 HD domain-containing protein [Corynebacterium sp.]